uniref:Uncharacterized protein n=1 Tax=viral metagenome TaxID=1070528 RepID=A0A6H1ZZV3_9ZZZZ
MSYWRQRRVVELHKKVSGQPSVKIPDEIIELEESIQKLKGELAASTARRAPEAELSRIASELTPLEYRFRQLLISYELKK